MAEFVYLTARWENPVPVLNAPAQGVPGEGLRGLVERIDLQRGQRKPLQRFLFSACTLGFIALITVQQEIVTGVVMLALFGVGHCLPLIACGVFSARTMELLHSRGGQRTVAGLRRLAAVVIALLGVYFSANPFL